MKVEAKSINELFDKSGELKPLFIELDRVIRETVPDLERSFYPGKSINMIAYGLFPYKTTKEQYLWPVIGLAPQKSSVNIYISGITFKMPISEFYKEKLGKVSAGKSCIRIKKIESLNIEEFKNMLRDAEKWFLDNPMGNTV